MKTFVNITMCSGTKKELTSIMNVSPNPATQTVEVYILFKTDKS
jgi:hypothetical protein